MTRPAKVITTSERVTDLELASRLRGLVTHGNLWSAGARHGDEEQLKLDLEADPS